MIRLVYLLTLILFSYNCFSQHYNKKSRNIDSVYAKCKESWEYFNLKGSITGQVISHFKAPFHCGTFATASITIIQTDTDDTIRVLALCNVDKAFKYLDKVKVTPTKQPSFTVVTHPHKEDCSIKKTCYGNVYFINKLTADN